MAQVKGIYKFKDTLIPLTFDEEEVNFYCKDINSDCFKIRKSVILGDELLVFCHMYMEGDMTEPEVVEDTVYGFGINQGWTPIIKEKTIDFGEEPQEVSDEFYAWLMKNTVTIKINITENGTTILATAGKYCDRNIDVNVNVDTDAFWDSFQNYGNRTFYEYAFSRTNFEQLHPKYKVVPTSSRTISMFQDMTGVKVIEKAYFDLSNCTVSQNSGTGGNYHTFSGASGASDTLEVIEDIGLQAGYYYFTFAYRPLLHTIEVLRVVEETMFNGAFAGCSNLQNITIEGTIGQNGFNVSHCKKLTKESILSILQALSLNITATKTITFSTAHQSIIETDTDCVPYWESAKAVGWSFVYA